MNNESDTDFFDSITRFGMGTGIIGFVVFAMSYIFVTCLNHAAENQVTYNLIKYLILTFLVNTYYNLLRKFSISSLFQAYKIRQVFLTSVLRQNIGWYDTHQTSDFAAKMAE